MKERIPKKENVITGHAYYYDNGGRLPRHQLLRSSKNDTSECLSRYSSLQSSVIIERVRLTTRRVLKVEECTKGNALSASLHNLRL